ncbi:DUF4388 domain-containing protein [Geomonas sp. Red32]|uniref:DUF4388 domain-containing protein n=1 Tax=Geomonas sp. Red32 TaxID=2912856 RepID=UPI00202CFB4A|nr:DUF4388 domain-containing protein [Geomonas sp. Red32]MCM0081002.1 DUF4388 domain-containing protein [Geomonas sp. Red32]
MSFDGDLQHFPIADVIQLLHATAKSGTLTLRSLKGESQLVFKDGYIVSANHVNNSVRIGQILMDMGVITAEELESALHEQQKAGSGRKPIIQTLIEGGRIHPDQAYHGLEVLIEMTIVEVLTWIRGTFSLDVEKTIASDEYRYFPEQLKKDIHLNTQSVLMDALRIYDERKRDGTLEDGSLFRPLGPGLAMAAEPADAELSAADLGLDELDGLERKIPKAFSALDEVEEETPKKRLQGVLTGIAAEEQQQLFRYLESLADRPEPLPAEAAVVLFSADPVVRECVSAVSGAGFVCATRDAAGLDAIIDQLHSKGRRPVLVVDGAEAAGRPAAARETVALVQEKVGKFAALRVLVLCAPWDLELSAHALQSGAEAVVPKASRAERRETFISDTIECSRALDAVLRKGAPALKEGTQGSLPRVKELFSSFADLREPSEVTFTLLKSVGGFFSRAVTFVAVRSELVAERGIGVTAPGEVTPLRLRLPVAPHSLLQQTLEGQCYYGDADASLRETIRGAIGLPASMKALLLPVKSFGRVIALIYADFGDRAGGEPQLELLEVLAQHAGVVIDNALYRKRCAQK